MERIAIKRIYVEKLFGYYDYEIPNKGTKKEIENIMILYGDNGSGKTTILRTIFHLLASDKAAGHKSYVARTKFSHMQIDFNNGYTVIARRESPLIIGSFIMELYKDGQVIDTLPLVVDSDSSTVLNKMQAPNYSTFLDKIQSLGLSIYLLSDDRTVQFSSHKTSDEDSFTQRWGMKEYLSPNYRTFLESSINKIEDLTPELISIILLQNSIDKAAYWIHQQVMRSTTKGETDVNLIYSDIVNKIASSRINAKSKKIFSQQELNDRIVSIEKRNKMFSKFGISSHFNGAKFLEAIQGASREQLNLIGDILPPFLESFEVKMAAMEIIRNRIETLVNTLNLFFIDKDISYTTEKGFVIKSHNKEKIDPKVLSSGERHLLLIFCNALTALDQRSIFIIDEPELSLNVKWQRTLIPSLLNLVKNSPVQFIFATHSLEILSQHDNNVVQLITIGENNAKSKT